jgi:hypothetical protein
LSSSSVFGAPAAHAQALRWMRDATPVGNTKVGHKERKFCQKMMPLSKCYLRGCCVTHGCVGMAEECGKTGKTMFQSNGSSARSPPLSATMQVTKLPRCFCLSQRAWYVTLIPAWATSPLCISHVECFFTQSRLCFVESGGLPFRVLARWASALMKQRQPASAGPAFSLALEAS